MCLSDKEPGDIQESDDAMPTGQIVGVLQRNWRDYVACFAEHEVCLFFWQNLLRNFSYSLLIACCFLFGFHIKKRLVKPLSLSLHMVLCLPVVWLMRWRILLIWVCVDRRVRGRLAMFWWYRLIGGFPKCVSALGRWTLWETTGETEWQTEKHVQGKKPNTLYLWLFGKM